MRQLDNLPRCKGNYPQDYFIRASLTREAINVVNESEKAVVFSIFYSEKVII